MRIRKLRSRLTTCKTQHKYIVTVSANALRDVKIMLFEGMKIMFREWCFRVLRRREGRDVTIGVHHRRRELRGLVP